MYRSRIYGTAQFTGFATPAETNQLYRRLLAQGMTSLYMACGTFPASSGMTPTTPGQKAKWASVVWPSIP